MACDPTFAGAAIKLKLSKKLSWRAMLLPDVAFSHCLLPFPAIVMPIPEPSCMRLMDAELAKRRAELSTVRPSAESPPVTMLAAGNIVGILPESRIPFIPTAIVDRKAFFFFALSNHVSRRPFSYPTRRCVIRA